MPIIQNHTKQRLTAGELTIGFGIRQARTVDIAKIIGSCGYDWLSIDMEHNTMGIDTATQICVAALDAGAARGGYCGVVSGGSGGLQPQWV